MTRTLRTKAAIVGMITGPMAAGVLGEDQFPQQQSAIPPWQAIDGERYLWSGVDPFNSAAEWRMADHTGALDAFVRLTDGPSVLRFARRYSSLGICAHGLPNRAGHRNSYNCKTCDLNTLPRCKRGHCTIAETAAAASTEPCVSCATRRDCWHPLIFWEPISGWLWMSKIARSVVALAVAIYSQRRPEDDSWTFLWEVFGKMAFPPVDPRHDALPPYEESAVRTLVSTAIFWWLEAGDVRPMFWWDEQGTHVEFGGGLFGALGLQLMRAAGRAHSLSICSGCGQTYQRLNRRPKTGQRNYCPECRAGTANTIRQRESRERRRKEESHGKTRKR